MTAGTQTLAGAVLPPGSRLQTLHPGWFAVVMGTAIVAVATYDNPGGIAALSPTMQRLGVALAILAYLVAGVLLVAYALRVLRHPSAVRADLRHPVMGALYGTVPGGLLVLAVMTSLIGPDRIPEALMVGLVAGLDLVGGALALTISVAFAYVLFTGRPEPASVNGGWFIPPVVTLIVPVALVPLMSHVNADSARLLLFAGYAFYGMGFLLFLFVMGLLHDRLVLQPAPPAAMAPSLWIGLGPVGVGVIGALALVRAGQPLLADAYGAVTVTSQLAATAIWGFGLWWLAATVALTARYVRSGGVPFSIGWWAFTFPLGAFTVATLTLARTWHLGAVETLGALLYVGLVGLWLMVALRTVRAMRTGIAWQR